VAARAERLYREFRQMDDVSPLAIEGLLLEILADASRRAVRAHGRRRPRWLEQVRDLLHSRFAERLALAELGEAVNVHPIYLASQFRRHFGCTLGDYLRRLRVDFAARDLAGSETPLWEIALAAGFSDQSHFTRIFKQHTGLTPAAYREMARS
jgi:AraC family transcriptional regulator